MRNKKMMMKKWNKKMKSMKNKLNLGQDNIIWKFGDLIKLWISLIHLIKDLIEEIPKFGPDLGQNCKKLKSKDYFVDITKNSGVQLQFIQGLITRFQNFSDQIKNDYSHHTNSIVFKRYSSPYSPSALGTVSRVKGLKPFQS